MVSKMHCFSCEFLRLNPAIDVCHNLMIVVQCMACRAIQLTMVEEQKSLHVTCRPTIILKS